MSQEPMPERAPTDEELAAMTTYQQDEWEKYLSTMPAGMVDDEAGADA